MSSYLSVYITVPTQTVAEAIAQALVAEKLAACVNILPPLRSVYRWQGTIEHTEEIALLAKTRRDCFPALERLVKSLHPYACPCMVAWPIVAGHAPYLDWLTRETSVP